MELLIIVIIIVALLFSPRIIRSIRRNNLIAAIKGFQGVPISQYFVQNDGHKGIGISIPSKSVVYFSNATNSTIFHATEISNCEIFLNQQSISKQSSINIISRYLVGKALGGSSFGETLGTTGKEKINHEISGVELLFSTSRPGIPTFSLIMLENGKGSIGQRAYKSGHYIKSLIETLK